MDQVRLHKNCNIGDLIDYGFKRRKSKEIVYTRMIPLYKYNGKVVIEGQFAAFMTHGYIGYDIVDSCSGNLYSAYYDREWSNSNENNVLKTVRDNLNEEFRTMKKAGIINKYKEV